MQNNRGLHFVEQIKINISEFEQIIGKNLKLCNEHSRCRILGIKYGILLIYRGRVQWLGIANSICCILGIKFGILILEGAGGSMAWYSKFNIKFWI